MAKFSKILVICSDGQKKVYNSRAEGWLEVEIQGDYFTVVSFDSAGRLEKVWGHHAPIYTTATVSKKPGSKIGVTL